MCSDMKNATGGRNLEIDIIKGVSIMLVLWGHTIQNLSPEDSYYSDWIFKMIYSFHMSLFALINGYLFYSSQRKRNFVGALRSRLTGLLYPIIVWTTLDWILGSAIHKKIVMGEWIDLFTGNMLWFLWSIFAANLVLIIAEKWIELRWAKIIWLIFGFFVMYMFPNAELNLFLYPYVILGFYYKKHDESSLSVRKYGWICILFFILLLPLYKETSFIYTTGISLWKSDVTAQPHILINLYRYVIGLVGSVTVIYIVCVLGGKHKTLDRMLSKCGQYTMQIYILQCFFFKVFAIVWTKLESRLSNSIILLNTIFRDIIVAIPFCLVLLFVIFSASKIFERSDLVNKIFFGR